MLRPVRTAAPSADLLELAAVKLHLRVDVTATDEDSLITALIGAATAYLDGYAGILGRCLINQTWRQDYAGFEGCLRLPFPDVSSVTLKYYDSANALQTVLASNYQLLEDARGAYLELLSTYATPTLYQYRGDPVQVVMVAGYGAAASSVPVAITQAALLLIGHWYANRESVNIGNITSELPLGARALLAPFTRKAA